MPDPALFNSLFREAIEHRKPVSFVLEGMSMFPSLRQGDVLTVHPVNAAQLREGDIIAYQDKETGRVIVHRLIRCLRMENGCSLVTAADAGCHHPDPVFDAGQALIARVISVARKGKLIDLTSWPAQAGARLKAFFMARAPLLVRVYQRLIWPIRTG